MTTEVFLRRTRTKGLVANIWISDPVTAWREKIIFVNDAASIQLERGTTYTLSWAIEGAPGDELTIDHKIDGVDDDFVPLLQGSKIPDDDHASRTGAHVTFADFLQFTLR